MPVQITLSIMKTKVVVLLVIHTVINVMVLLIKTALAAILFIVITSKTNQLFVFPIVTVFKDIT